jgi:hypothetical protein
MHVHKEQDLNRSRERLPISAERSRLIDMEEGDGGREAGLPDGKFSNKKSQFR